VNAAVADAVQPAVETGSQRVAVVIPSYNMAWCVERAIASCLAQSRLPDEIIVVDDCSTDGTEALLTRIAAENPRIRYVRQAVNGGHLAALASGVALSAADWTALLDADDELTPDSIERRVDAALDYRNVHGEWPQLVYGDLYWERIKPGAICRFKQIVGRDFPFLTRELSLCQTSTILLGRRALEVFPEPTNPYNTDDEIVLCVGKHFAVVHAGVAVTVTHAHDSDTRMSNSSLRRLRGISQLVRDHRRDIVRHHGVRRLMLWQLRVLRAWIEWRRDRAHADRDRSPARARVAAWRERWLDAGHRRLTAFLEPRFEQMYF
jgi:glycosyltransferase involved in cell wall biosynthesis